MYLKYILFCFLIDNILVLGKLVIIHCNYYRDCGYSRSHRISIYQRFIRVIVRLSKVINRS